MVEEYVYGTSKRIFINTAIGCNACCKYCYMPRLGYSNKEKIISGEAAVKLVMNMSCFKRGQNGTILSLGCYSECLDLENIRETKKVITNLLPLENQIQLATKQKVTEDICKLIRNFRRYTEQIKIYISMPTISRVDQLEPGTVSIEQRILNIENCIKYKIPVVLYIKPFLENITENDLKDYIKIVKKYRIPVVIGGYLDTEEKKEVADVGNGRLYEMNNEEKRKWFEYELSKYTEVYEHSIECC